MQEKINKVALKFAKKNSDLYETSNYGSMYFGFINGAKWKQEKMYSKKELEVAFFEGRENNITFIEWFKQFKKK